jgi:hypothetical protein
MTNPPTPFTLYMYLLQHLDFFPLSHGIHSSLIFNEREKVLWDQHLVIAKIDVIDGDDCVLNEGGDKAAAPVSLIWPRSNVHTWKYKREYLSFAWQDYYYTNSNWVFPSLHPSPT